MLLFNCQIILIIKKKISKWIACAVYFDIETVPGKIFWVWLEPWINFWSYGCFIVTAGHVMIQGQDLCRECFLFLIA